MGSPSTIARREQLMASPAVEVNSVTAHACGWSVRFRGFTGCNVLFSSTAARLRERVPRLTANAQRKRQLLNMQSCNLSVQICNARYTLFALGMAPSAEHLS